MVRSVARGQFRVTWALDEPMWAPDEVPLATSAGDDGGALATPALSAGYEGFALGDIDSPDRTPASVAVVPEEPERATEPEPPGPASVPWATPPVLELADPGTNPTSETAGPPRGSAKKDTPKEEEEQAGTPPTTEPPPEPRGPSRREPAASPPPPAALAPKAEEALATLPSPAEPLPARRGPRGQFHVMSAWHEVPPAISVPPTEKKAEPAREEGLPLSQAPMIHALPGIVPERPVPQSEALPAPPPGGPAVVPEPAPQVPPSGVEPGRTLLGLLARMWLMRAPPATSGGLALEPPSPPAPPPAPRVESPPPTPPPVQPARPAEPVPTVPLPPPVAPEATVVPVALPSPPPLPLAEPAARPALREPQSQLPPDVDDRRPVSGLASLLIEMAEMERPRPSPELRAPTTARTTVVLRFVHCRHPIPDHPVSRDACRQRRVGR